MSRWPNKDYYTDMVYAFDCFDYGYDEMRPYEVSFDVSNTKKYICNACDGLISDKQFKNVKNLGSATCPNCNTHGTVTLNYDRRSSEMGRSKYKRSFYREKTDFCSLPLTDYNLNGFIDCIKLARKQSRRPSILADREMRVRLFINNLRSFLSSHSIKMMHDFHDPRNWIDAGVVNAKGSLKSNSLDSNIINLNKFCEAAMLSLDSSSSIEDDIDNDLLDLKSLIASQEVHIMRLSSINQKTEEASNKFVSDIDAILGE